MKRVSNLYEKIISLENLRKADAIAQKGKKKQYGVTLHNQNSEANILKLHEMLKGRTYKTSEYQIFKVYEPKERDVFKLPYFPDRIVHHAIMLHLEKLFVSVFTADTYSCIKGKGIYAASRKLKLTLKDVPGTKYCLKLDVRKFYPSIDHDVLKTLLRRKIKDQGLLWLLDEIIDSADGLPIGNYLSQYFANYFLTGFDHWIKENKRVRYYFRYADDIVILSGSKVYLHSLLGEIKLYLSDNLKLKVKDNYQVFPVSCRGIDFLGYRFYHEYVLLRKSIKKRFAKAVSKSKDRSVLAAYWGWAKHCDSKHLIKKLIPNEKF
ncbi:RNA-directed DNA polymerase [Flavobacterium anhuiense]|uniref:RNA-directed DNA polymerase n=1 Tax=Flavobacterium anhuiense TaxID=459526 RepID=UPI000E6CA42B|nr:RNA-directed DNA polymerase [Flavobacterium anhuiense]